MAKKEKKETIIYPVGDESFHETRMLEKRLDILAERVRVNEYSLQGMQKTIFSIDEDYQLAKHEKRIACMCCPFIKKSK